MHQVAQAIKLVLALTTSTLVTGAKEAQKLRVLDQVPCICYLVQLRKDKGKDVLALFNSKSNVNAIIPAYTAQLGLKVQKTNVGAQKLTDLY